MGAWRAGEGKAKGAGFLGHGGGPFFGLLVVVFIKTLEGGETPPWGWGFIVYAGCWSWLVSVSSGISAGNICGLRQQREAFLRLVPSI